MKFRTEKYPSLIVHDIGVHFVDGEAEVTDPKKIEVLKKLDDSHGVKAVGGRAPKDPPKDPPKEPAGDQDPATGGDPPQA